MPRLTHRTLQITLVSSLTLLCAGRGAAAPHDRRVRLALDASAGYGGLAGTRGTSLDSVGLSGPIFSGALSLSWPAGSNRIGVRASGSFSPAQGEESNFSIWGGGSGREVEGRVVTGHLGMLGERGGLWGAIGAGVIYVATSRFDGMRTESRDSLAPDLCFNLGYNAWLSDHVAVRFTAEVGGFFLLATQIRASAQAGFLVRI